MTKRVVEDMDKVKDAKPLMDALCDLKCKYNLTLILIEHTCKVNESCRATQAGRNDSREARRKRTCPKCGRQKNVPYINTVTGDPLHPTVGKCDRADNCAWHYSPSQYFKDRGSSFDKSKVIRRLKVVSSNPRKIPHNRHNRSLLIWTWDWSDLALLEKNNLVLWLRNRVGAEAANEAIRRYRFGTSKYWKGATVFWQIDGEGRIRTGKIMLYDRRTGHRIKVNGQARINWAHKALKLTDFNLNQPLREHLLSGNNKPVAIVESEKTAIIESARLPNFVWLACGGCGNLSAKLCEPLRGRKVLLCPDAGKYNEWKEKVTLLSAICDISVSDWIEQRATEGERKAGLDGGLSFKRTTTEGNSSASSRHANRDARY